MNYDDARKWVAWVILLLAGCSGSPRRPERPAPTASSPPARCDPSCCKQETAQPDRGGLPALARSLRQGAREDGAVLHQVDKETLLSLLQMPGVQGQLLHGRPGGPPFLVGLVTPVGKVLVIPYECSVGQCKSIQFYYGVDLPGRTAEALVNEFNQRYRFGRAYVDGDGDPCLEWDLDLEPGVARASVPAALKVFLGVVGRYVAFLQAKGAGGSAQKPTP